MKLFSLFKDRGIKPAWQYETDGQLWRMLFSDSGRIVGEDRDEEKKEVTFFCLDEVRGKVLWNHVGLSERWWIGIETLYDGIVYLHEYVKPDLPQHKRIIALDIESGTILWRNDELLPLFVARDKFYAAKETFEKRIYYELNTRTGEIEREFSEIDENLDPSWGEKGIRNQDIEFPEVMQNSGGDSNRLWETVGAHCDVKKAVGDIEYIQRENLLFFNYHERVSNLSADPPILKNIFKVVETKRNRVVYSEALNERVLAPAPDSFFFKGSQLFYVKNKNLLSAIRLNKFAQDRRLPKEVQSPQ
jgi:outer membrane protein assembly factor BamB